MNGQIHSIKSWGYLGLKNGSKDRQIVGLPKFSGVRAENEDLTNVTEEQCDIWHVKYMDLPLKSEYLKLGC